MNFIWTVVVLKLKKKKKNPYPSVSLWLSWVFSSCFTQEQLYCEAPLYSHLWGLWYSPGLAGVYFHNSANYSSLQASDMDWSQPGMITVLQISIFYLLYIYIYTNTHQLPIQPPGVMGFDYSVVLVSCNKVIRCSSGWCGMPVKNSLQVRCTALQGVLL